MPSRKIIVVLILVLLITVVGVLLLKKFKPEKQESATGRIYTNEKVTESEGSLSLGFPNVPVYPEITLQKSYKREQGGKTDFTAYWYYEGSDDQSIEFMRWYIDEFKKAGWNVEGPFVDEGENELSISAENSKYKLRLYNSENDEGDKGGPVGNYIAIDVYEK